MAYLHIYISNLIFRDFCGEVVIALKKPTAFKEIAQGYQDLINIHVTYITKLAIMS